MKKILLIATGGTIASKPTGHGLAPQLGTDEILSFVPEIRAIADVTAIQLFNLDSSDMTYTHWIKIAECIHDNYDLYDGFVITHGTDTMAYSASAISYLVQNSPKPIVFTGSQKSIYMRDTDARNNLYNAFAFAVDPSACLVHIVFEDKVMIGNRSRKIRTKSYNAFESVDFPEVGVMRDGRLIRYVDEKANGHPDFYFDMDPRVFVFKLVPGVGFDIFSKLKEDFDCIIIESFGAGNLPMQGGHSGAIKDWIDSGRSIVVTTQVPHEGSDMSVYEAGNNFKQCYGVIEAYNMTLEAVLTKMMWILARTHSREETAMLFYTPVQRDIIL